MSWRRRRVGAIPASAPRRVRVTCTFQHVSGYARAASLTLSTCSTDGWGLSRAQVAWVASLALGPVPDLSAAVRVYGLWRPRAVSGSYRLMELPPQARWRTPVRGVGGLGEATSRAAPCCVRAGGGAGAARGLFSCESWLCVFFACLSVEGVRARVPHGNASRRNVCGSPAVVPNVLQIAS